MSTDLAPHPTETCSPRQPLLEPPRSGMPVVVGKGLFANVSRFVLTAVAVVLSVAFFASILLLTDALRGSSADDIATANAGLDVMVSGEQLASGSAGPQQVDLSADLPPELATTIAGLDGVASAQGVSSGYARVLDADGVPVDVGSFGYAGESWIIDDDSNPYTLFDGAAPTSADEVVIERSIAEELDVGVGDRIDVVTSSGTLDATVSGIATYGSADGSPTTSAVLLAPDHAADVLGTAGFDRIVVELDDGTVGESASDTAVAAFESAVAGIAGDSVLVASGASVTDDLVADVDERTGFQTTFLLFFAVVALVAGSTIIYNTFVIAVHQRTRELALLRSIGASRRQVLVAVLGEAAVIGLVSSVIGALLGIAGFRGLIRLFEAIGLSFLSSDAPIAAVSLIVPVVVGIVVTLGSAFFPARRAASTPPIAALQDAAVDSSGESALRTWIGATLIAVATGITVAGVGGVPAVVALLVGFIGVIVAGPALTRLAAASIGRLFDRGGNVTGQLARTNAARNPKRSASTAFALTLGVALVALFSVVADSLSSGVSGDVGDGVRTDLVVASISDQPGDGLAVPAGFASEIDGLGGVELVAPVATGSASIDGEFASIGGVDPVTLDAAYDLAVVDGSLDSVEGTTIAAHTDTGLSIGDQVAVRAAGAQETLTVGVLFDRALPGTPVGPEYVMESATFDQFVPGALDSYVFVATDGSGAVADALRDATSDAGGISLYTAEAYAESLGSFLDTFQNFVYSLLGVAVIIALVGIANTTVMSINERRREIGVLRAVGMTARQVRSMIRREALLLSIQGSIVGLALGVVGASSVFSLLAGDEGFSLTIPWARLAVIGVLGAVAGVGASAWPAWRAGRRAPLEAMADVS